MGLCYASSSLARHCPTSCSNIVASQAFSRFSSDCRTYPLSRRAPCVALWVSGQRSLWTSASSLTHASNWRQLPRIVRPLSTYKAPKDHFQTLETQWQRKRQGEVEPLAVRTCTFFDARSPSGTRRAVKSRKLDPPRTAKSPPRDNYLWVAGLIQDSKDTGYAILISRKLVFGFVVVFSSSWLLFNIELTYSASNYSREKPNTKIAHWLQSFSKVVHPRFPDENDPLMMDIVMGERPCDWLHSYVSLIPQLTSAFACTTWNSVRNSSLLILAYVPLLKQVMSSRQIVLAYIAGGFLASNIEGAVMYFTNPYASLSAAGLQELLDHIPPSLYPPSSRERLYDCQMYDLRELENEATVMMGAALEEERKELEAKIIEKKKEVEGLRELDSTFIYTRRALGTSCAITCLGEWTSTEL
jgi:hypothetical protein